MQGHSTVRMDIPENYEAIFSFIFDSILSHIPLSQKRERERGSKCLYMFSVSCFVVVLFCFLLLSLFDCVFVLIN